MFKIIKEYVLLLNKANIAKDIKELEKINLKIFKINYNNLNTKIRDIDLVINELNIKFPVGIYIDYYKKGFIKNENIFSNKLDLNNFLMEYIDIIKKTWGLNCYMSINDISFLQLHYQDTIILYTQK